jgi:UDP-glucose 4-epimerase
MRQHDIEAVVHLAAIVQPAARDDDETLHDIEVGGTERVMQAAWMPGSRHVTVTSSGAAYGYHLFNRNRWLTEDDPVRGSDEFAYSRHKAEVERLLARYRRMHPDLGQLVLRPGTILGESPTTRSPTCSPSRSSSGCRTPTSRSCSSGTATSRRSSPAGVAQRITGIYNLAGDGALTLRRHRRHRGQAVRPPARRHRRARPSPVLAKRA